MFDLLKSMPGFNIKMGLEMLSQHVIKHAGHEVDKYELRLFLATSRIEYLITYPFANSVPEQYRHDGKSIQSGFGLEKIPARSHLYIQEIEAGISNVVADALAEQFPDFAGTIDYAVIDIDRNKKEYPYTLYYTHDGKKLAKKGVLK